MIYSDFSRSIHVVEPYPVPKEWTRVVGLDHGYTNPAAALFAAVDYDGNIVVYDEFYEREWLIQDICKKGLVPKIGSDKIEGIWIDPSTRATRGQTGLSDFSTYLEHLPPKISLSAANNAVSPGIDRVKSYMRVNERTKKPRLTIFSTCKNLIEEIGEYRWAELAAGQEGTKNQKEEPRKYNDHACDALRYLVMSRPEPTKLKDRRNFDKEFPTPSIVLQRELQEIRSPKEKDPFGDY